MISRQICLLPFFSLFTPRLVPLFPAGRLSDRFETFGALCPVVFRGLVTRGVSSSSSERSSAEKAFRAMVVECVLERVSSYFTRLSCSIRNNKNWYVEYSPFLNLGEVVLPHSCSFHLFVSTLYSICERTNTDRNIQIEYYKKKIRYI